MAITASTSCCGRCGRWYFGYLCPYCAEERKKEREEYQRMINRLDREYYQERNKKNET